jgi:beta-lactamase class A
VQNLAGGVNASIGVTLIELGGRQPRTWSYNGGGQFTAASTYKLPTLMANAQAIASGRASGSDQICFQDADYEDGAFGDYYPGACYSRNELAWRAGHYSDNTAAHMLVRDLGGSAGLNSYAAQHGATQSGFFDPNVTTSNDLAALWASEASGGSGGPAAQAWLYQLLTNTEWENGIPAGTPGSKVIHKTGAIYAVENDAGLVVNGPHGAYILVVLTDGAGGDLGTELIAQVARRVWLFEASRPA